MKHLSIICLSLLLSVSTFSQTEGNKVWDSFLQKHVSANGNVNYKAIKSDRSQLDQYLNWLRKSPPQSSWSKKEAMAYWVNAYNAFTIALIIDNYPVKSINDIKKGSAKPWDIGFIKIGQKTYTLNHIEHKILRVDYFDPRIHFAVNCASFSCPPLLNRAFTAAKIDGQMDLLAKKFINDKSRNKITANSAQLSEIFNWFKSDFTKKGSLIAFINQYSTVKIASSAKISYLPYNWNLNQ